MGQLGIDNSLNNLESNNAINSTGNLFNNK